MEKVSSEVQKWLDHISAYESEFDKWEAKSEKIIKRYRSDDRQDGDKPKFNVLWSNVQTLTAATFSRIPKPDVSRRFKDSDPVGRVAALLLERALDYEVSKYASFSSALSACVLDRFLGGRGTAWIRYEPHFRASEHQVPQDGSQITEDEDQPQEELDYECSPCDYVHWRDFGHVVSRTWEEVPAVWRRVYLTKDKAIERFGEEIGKKIPLDATPEDQKKAKAGNTSTSETSRALVYEIWDKSTKTAIWLSKSMNEIIETKPDPLGLEDFWPCPKPMFSTLTNDSLVPIPDYTLYQDQAIELDFLTDRIDGLIHSLRVAGVYDASVGDLQRLFTENGNNTLIPVKNWTAFAEKNGLKGSIDIIDLAPIAAALNQAYIAMEQVKQQIYDITGISDIIRGQSSANETATAQQIKGQYASLRLKKFQDEVARFATEVLQIQAQIICNLFSAQTLLTISAATELPEADRQYIQPAIELLTQKGPNPTRLFRIEVAADSLILLDEAQEKQDRLEFLTAISGFMEKSALIVQGQPETLPLIGELLKFGVRAFKVGKSVESAFDTAIEGAGKKPPSPTEEEMKALDQKKQEIDAGLEQLTAQQEEMKNIGHDLERKKNDIEKAEIQLEKKALEVGFQENTLGLETDFNDKQQKLKKTHEEDMTMAESKLLEASEALASISESMRDMVASNTSMNNDSYAKLAEVINSISANVEKLSTKQKRVTRISKDETGAYVAEDL